MDITQLSLAAAIVVTGHYVAVCHMPPAPSTKSQVKDDMSRWVSPTTQRVRVALLIAIYLHHLLLVLTRPSEPAFYCPHPANLNTSLLFSWSPYLAACLGAVNLIGAPLRLHAFSALGSNFTFHLQKPSRLETGGIYRFVQHPSYSGQMLVILGTTAAAFRWDGAMGCWIGEGVRQALRGWGLVAFAAVAAVVAAGVKRRVADEEKMLKESYGEEWVRWHAATSRFVPFLL